MGKRFAVVTAFLVALAFNVGCGVHQTEAPALSGPSEQSTSFLLTAIPDSISQDGASQSSVTVFVRDANSRPIQGLSMRLDMAVGNTIQDFGTLSARTVVTGSDGKAFAIYTAPSPPPASQGGSSTHVQVVVRPIGNNAQTTIIQTVDIRLVPPGVISAPAGTPIAAFTISPTPVAVAVPVTFDASSSSPGTGANSITSYAWNFGDGTTGSGRAVSHTFSAAGTYSVTVTVTNDRGLSASSTLPVTVGAGEAGGGVAAPTAKFVFSPSAPLVNQTIQFNAEESSAASGHTLTSISWNFGDGSTASGVAVSHAYSTAGTYAVVVTVIDDTGQRATTSQSVSPGAPGGGASTSPTAAFTFSPQSPGVGATVFFNASTSTAGTGHTISSYAWTFGDGTSGTGVSPTHAYVAAGSYGVQLTVTNDASQTSTSAPTAISVGGNSLDPTAGFTFSPTGPARNETVVFDASSSSTQQGQTITDVAWNFGDSTGVVHCPADGPTFCSGTNSRITPHRFLSAGSFVVNLVVTDSAGRIGSKNTNVIIVTGDPVVKIDVSPGSPFAATPVNFDSSGTTYFSGASAGTIAWSFPGGAPASSALANQNVTYAFPGTYTVRLTITDTLGRTGTITKDVTVQNASPTAQLTITNTVAPAFSIQADASGSTAVGGATIATYNFAWGDGSANTNGAAASVPHTFPGSGTYTVRVTVTDSLLRTGTTTALATIP